MTKVTACVICGISGVIVGGLIPYVPLVPMCIISFLVGMAWGYIGWAAK